MKRKLLSVITAVAVTATLLAGCGKTEAVGTEQAPAAETAETADTAEVADTAEASGAEQEAAADEFEGEGLNEVKVVNIGFLSSSTTAQISAAKNYVDDALKAYGYDVAYTEFVTGPPAIEALTAGDIDFAYIGNLPVYTGVSNGSKIKAIYKPPVTENGMYGIVVPGETDIKETADLAGKNIAVVAGTAAHAYLELLLGTAGLSLDDITLVNVAPADVATVVSNGDADAAVLWEPVVTKVAAAVGGSVILRSKGITEDQWFIAAREEFLEKNPLVAAIFVSGAIQADQFAIDNPEEAKKIIAENTGDTVETWSSLDNLQKVEEFTQADYDTADQVKAFLEKNDLLQGDIDGREIMVNKYWKKAAELLK